MLASPWSEGNKSGSMGSLCAQRIAPRSPVDTITTEKSIKLPVIEPYSTLSLDGRGRCLAQVRNQTFAADFHPLTLRVLNQHSPS